MTEKPTTPKMTPPRLTYDIRMDPSLTYEFRAISSTLGTVRPQVRGIAICPRCHSERPMWHDVTDGERLTRVREVKCGRCSKTWPRRLGDDLGDFRGQLALDRISRLKRDCCESCAWQWASLSWWRKVLARIGGRR